MNLRRGTNWEAVVKTSHKETKGMIQSQISVLKESGVGNHSNLLNSLAKYIS
ncbi:hypothetical protein [Bacillus sp. 3103sda1]|uniref:hypothetical protein n=1 Tax=Bacillus sp. 3103sda1 TaxID=2953808 RepID=UPI0035C93ADE